MKRARSIWVKVGDLKVSALQPVLALISRTRRLSAAHRGSI
ncbi:hypothetical protein [Pseudomonas sp. AMR01]